MAWKLKYRCTSCGYEAEVYEGQGLFRQQISPMSCPDCKTIQNIVVGGIIGDVAPSFRSEAGRLCLNCGSADIRPWDKHTCPKCQGDMQSSPTLSQIAPLVATTSTRIRLISWNQPKIPVPLQQLSYFHTLFVHFCINLVF